MALCGTVWYALLTLLGLSVRPNSRPTEGTVGSSCLGLNVRDGSASCSNDGSQTVCEVFCEGKPHGEFTCIEDEGWTPELPTCARPIEDNTFRKIHEHSVGSSCLGLNVRDGSVSCSNDGSQTVCEVFCEGKHHGEFTCTEDEGWTPELPTCAKPIEDNTFRKIPEHSDAKIHWSQPPRENGCPDDSLCNRNCIRRGKKSGKCSGNTCQCR